jgi:hypothetical protein
MAEPMKTLAWLLLLIAGLSLAVRQPVHEVSQSSERCATSTAIQEFEPPNIVDRLCTLHPLLRRRLLEYRAEEGDKRRSVKFFALTLELDMTRAHTSSRAGEKPRRIPSSGASTIEILSVLGLPERGFVTGRDATFVYPFQNIPANKTWVAIVSIHDGVLGYIGWNDASVNDFSQFPPYHQWSDLLEASP